MTITGGLVAPLLGVPDRLVPDPAVRGAAKLALPKPDGSRELARIRCQLAATIAADPPPPVRPPRRRSHAA